MNESFLNGTIRHRLISCQFGVRANTVAFGYIDTRLTHAKEDGDFIITVDGERVPLGILRQ